MSELPVIKGRRVRLVLAALVVPLFLATLVGMWLLWPPSDSRLGSLPKLGPGVVEVAGKVTSLTAAQCPATGEVPTTEQGQDAICVQLTGGRERGSIVPVYVPPEVRREIHIGATLRLLATPGAESSGTSHIFWDMQRGVPLLALTAAYLVLVLAVARWRGAAAIVGLTGSCLVLVGFIIPALLAGRAPLPVVIVGASAMMFLSVYLAHGISVRTTTALLGTFAGLALTVGLAQGATKWAQLIGNGSEEAIMLWNQVPGLSLQTLLTCGIIIAGLGVLNDVTITQASAVWELHGANPDLSRRHLFGRAMRIGRDHIASTVYTLAFAYAGTALPTLLVAMMIDRPLTDTVLANEVAEEVIRTLVASIGLVLAIPATTAVGAALVRFAPEQNGAEAA